MPSTTVPVSHVACSELSPLSLFSLKLKGMTVALLTLNAGESKLWCCKLHALHSLTCKQWYNLLALLIQITWLQLVLLKSGLKKENISRFKGICLCWMWKNMSVGITHIHRLHWDESVQHLGNINKWWIIPRNNNKRVRPGASRPKSSFILHLYVDASVLTCSLVSV